MDRSRLRVHTASSLKAGWEPAFSGDHEIRRGGAKDFGIAVHELLERIDLRRRGGHPGSRALRCQRSVLTHRISEIEMCARNVLGHDVIRRALASRTCLREVAFTAPLPDANDGGLAEGRIDLLFVEDDEITIVDFKTDDVTVDEVAAQVSLVPQSGAGLRLGGPSHDESARPRGGLPLCPNRPSGPRSGRCGVPGRS